MKPKVLVLDAHQTAREELAWLLSDSGYPVTTATTPDELLRLASSAQPNVVIVDASSLQGRWEALLALRRSMPAAIVIVLITHADATQLSAATQAGADSFVLKSAFAIDLINALERRLQESQKKGGVKP